MALIDRIKIKEPVNIIVTAEYFKNSTFYADILLIASKLPPNSKITCLTHCPVDTKYNKHNLNFVFDSQSYCTLPYYVSNTIKNCIVSYSKHVIDCDNIRDFKKNKVIWLIIENNTNYVEQILIPIAYNFITPLCNNTLNIYYAMIHNLCLIKPIYYYLFKSYVNGLLQITSTFILFEEINEKKIVGIDSSNKTTQQQLNIFDVPLNISFTGSSIKNIKKEDIYFLTFLHKFISNIIPNYLHKTLTEVDMLVVSTFLNSDTLWNDFNKRNEICKCFFNVPIDMLTL